jgi:hypothetical protein
VIYTLADHPEQRGGMRWSNCGKTVAEGGRSGAAQAARSRAALLAAKRSTLLPPTASGRRGRGLRAADN